MTDVCLRPADPLERPVIENLIQLYLHDMTEFMPFPMALMAVTSMVFLIAFGGFHT